MSDSAAAPGADGAGSAVEKSAHPKKADAQLNLFERIALFLRQVLAELKKVVYPTRDELVKFTIVVLVFVTVVMAFISVVDLGVGWLVLKVFGG